MFKIKLLNLLKTLAKILVTCVALYYVFSKLDWVTFKHQLLKSNPYWLIVAGLLFALAQFINTFRLGAFFKAMNFDLDKKYNIKLYLLGLFYNVFLPGGIGGDGYKIYILRKQFNQSTKKLFWAIFLDRLSGLWALSLLSVLLCHILNIKTHHLIYTDVSFLIGSVVYYFVYRHHYSDFFTAIKTSHSLALLSQAILLTSASSILIAMNTSDSFAPYLTIFLISSLAAVIPISVGGLGVREAIFMYLAKQITLNVDTAVSLSLLFYVVGTSVSLLGGYFIFRSHEFAPMPEDEVNS